MPNTPVGMRECPTRADGTNALFAHVVSVATCQLRQRQHYHKCPTCSFYNARVGSTPAQINGHAVTTAQRLPPLEVPTRKPRSTEVSGNGRVPAPETSEAAQRPVS